MAELLIKLQANYIHPNSVKNNKGIYQRGDVIVVMPDGHKWGKEEHPKTTTYNPARCAPVKIPEMTVVEAQKYIQSEVNENIFDFPVVLKRRSFKFDIDSLKTADKSKFDTGELTIVSIEAKKVIKNKKTGLPEVIE